MYYIIKSDLLVEEVGPPLLIGRGNVIDGRFRLANHVSELLVAGGSSVESYILTIAAAGKDDESDSIVCGLGRHPF
jgi:hypothetical protein